MSTTGKEYRLAIRIAGIIDKSFSTSLAATNSTLKANVAAWDKSFTSLDKGYNKIMKTGQKCFSAITSAAGVAALAIGAATAAATATGTEFESAFAGVKKTVDATKEEYAELRQSILDMTRTIPSSANEIAGVMEIAGQLGIAKEALTDFTETMINLGVSTNVSAEEASESLAKFANIMTMANYGEDGISNFERLGSTIVDLGNKFATTEADIIATSTQLAAAGKLAGMSEADIMGISAAMSSVGLAAESGSSSMSRLIMQMQQAVSEGGDGLAGYAETAGMTSKEFAALFRDDAAGALVKFIEGLGEAGEDSYGILKDLELNTIRTRKAFLSLAGADDLMGRALDTANEAWDENVALAVEAGKRYETTASQAQILLNGMKELGIAAYDELREPLVDTLGIAIDKVHELTDAAKGPNGFGEWIDDIGTELPTLQRKFKKYGEPVFDGLVGAGKWVIKHGNGVVSLIAGIGSALAAYKIASTITHVVNALMMLSPTSWAIVGVATAITALMTAFTAYKLHERDMVNQNLADHFGSIALSMEDIQAIAEHIIGSDSLGGVKDALEAFTDLEVLSATMENAVSEIDKMNWKVSIGMELTESDQEGYKAAIDEYVSAAQEYALQSQYAVSLNLATSGLDQSITSKVNQFYQDSYDDLAALGTQLNDAVTDAFNDGLFDIKEAEVIANIQAEMAAIEEALATGEFDAKLSMMGMEYGGKLTADSFQNLQAELAEQTAAATEAYKESYAKNYAAIQATKEAGGYLTDAAYQTALDELQKEYLTNVGDIQAKALGFQLETIMKQYGDDVDIFNKHLEEVIANYSGEGLAFSWENAPAAALDTMVQDIYNNDVDEATKMAIEQLMQTMAPTIEQAEDLKQQYAELGIELSEELVKAFSSIDLLGAITVRDAFYGTKGDIGSAYDIAESSIVNDDRFNSVEKTLRGFNWELPVNQRANGGLATRPELTWFAEKGPEMAIPIDGSRNAISLWEKTGRLLGMDSVLNGLSLEGGGSGPTIEYKPTLQFYGQAPSKDDLTDALRVSQDEFDQLMERYFKTHGRVAFG